MEDAGKGTASRLSSSMDSENEIRYCFSVPLPHRMIGIQFYTSTMNLRLSSNSNAIMPQSFPIVFF